MLDRPLVSVLLPAYNHDRFVAESILSVCDQTYRPIELVVVDDGSTDATGSTAAALVGEARSRLDAVVFEQQSNRGIPRTLNRAMQHARGEYVAILGSDDVQLPHHLERLLAVADWSDPKTAVVFGDSAFIDEHGAAIGLREDYSTAKPGVEGTETSALAHHLRWRSDPEPGPLGSYASMLRGPYIPVAAALVRRSALTAVGNFDAKVFVEDYGLWLRLARDRRIVGVPDVVSRTRIHGANASVIHKRRVFRDMLGLMVRERPYCRADPVAEAERVASRNRAYLAVRTHGTGPDLLRVIAHHPFLAPSDLLAARRGVE